MALEHTSERWLGILDVVAKLFAAAAVVWGAYIANEFQATMTTATLQSQREQADSTLRASMFHDLIDPILGPERGNLPLDRELLLVELLGLNFHEHLELGPLMVHVDERLMREEIPGMDREAAREQLQSTARRVLQRQLALLTKEKSDLSSDDRAYIYRLDIEERLPQEIAKEISPPSPRFELNRAFGELIRIDSPNKAYTLYFTVSPPRRWEEQSFPVSMQIINKEDAIEAKTSQEATAIKKGIDKKTKTAIADRDFVLTWFDFPFIDNTLLADGTRFSLVIDRVDDKEKPKKVVLKFIWFPKDYFSLRERPTNYTEWKKLGLGP
jgi:hypothetical protein